MLVWACDHAETKCRVPALQGCSFLRRNGFRAKTGIDEVVFDRLAGLVQVWFWLATVSFQESKNGYEDMGMRWKGSEKR